MEITYLLVASIYIKGSTESIVVLEVSERKDHVKETNGMHIIRLHLCLVLVPLPTRKFSGSNLSLETGCLT